MKQLTAALILALLVPAAGCAPFAPLAMSLKTGQKGPLKSEARKVGGFERISVSGAMEVQLYRGIKPIVILEAESDVLSHLRAKVENGTLRLYSEGKFSTDAPIRARVTLPKLDGVQLDGATTLMSKSEWKSNAFRLEVTGASEVKLQLETKDLRVNSVGAGKTSLKGRADRLNLNMEGATSFQGEHLSTANASVRLSGASKAHVNADREIRGTLEGVSKLVHTGRAKVSVQTSGVSSVTSG